MFLLNMLGGLILLPGLSHVVLGASLNRSA
jgi:hypothetical protein